MLIAVRDNFTLSYTRCCYIE